jgi:alanyl-tRNA synthetase
MTGNEVRKKYLEFFEKRGHKIIPPAPLVLKDDPTTLFTSSGMQPLVPYLMGEEYPDGSTRLVDSQPSLRAQDIEEVGDNRHTTFFEMLGNWSLGDYFKKEQIEYLFKFLTDKEEGLGLDPKKLYISLFGGDENLKVKGTNEGSLPDIQALGIWRWCFKDAGVDNEVANNNQNEKPDIKNGRFFYYGVKKNWWSRAGTPKEMPVGEIGGPDTEVFYDFGDELKLHENSEWKDEPCHPNCDCGRFLEIGNSVFMQYQKVGEDLFEELPNKNVDFGGGLERLTAATNNDPDVFDIDLFRPAILKILSCFTVVDINNYKDGDYVKFRPPIIIEQKDQEKFGQNTIRSIRIIADHLRASVFLLSYGVVPSNKYQGYILRRLLRRALLYSRNLSINGNFMSQVAKVFIETYGSSYPEIKNHGNQILFEIEKEEVRFRNTLESGFKKIGEIFQNRSDINEDQAFELYTSYGFPIELQIEEAESRGKKVDIEGFNKKMKEHQEKSRESSKDKFKIQ